MHSSRSSPPPPSGAPSPKASDPRPLEANLLTYRETSVLLGIPLSSLYALVCRKCVPHVRLTGRTVRFIRHDLEVWLEERRIGVVRDDGRRR